MLQFKPSIPFWGLFVLIYACNPNDNDQSDADTYPNNDLMADAQWLQENIHRDDLRVVDMRAEGFENGHIPGSVSIKGAGALVDGDHNVDNYLIPPELFERIMGEYGISNDRTVIIYDDGNSLQASRLFYALELYGHQDVRILNGGFSAWKDQEGEISTTRTYVNPAMFHSEAREGLICDIAYVQGNIGNDDVVFYDARSLDEFEGKDVRANKGGSIPGAVHLEWSESIQAEGVPYFKKAAELQNMLNEKGITPDKEIIPYCQSNVRGAHVYFVLRLMGYDNVRPYEGSWSEYGNAEGAIIKN
ncbi:MAG: sulfurtransferase [Balneolales bacterium]